MYLFNYSFNSPLNCFISIFEISFVNFVNFFFRLRTPHSALRTPHSALRTPHSAFSEQPRPTSLIHQFPRVCIAQGCSYCFFFVVSFGMLIWARQNISCVKRSLEDCARLLKRSVNIFVKIISRANKCKYRMSRIRARKNVCEVLQAKRRKG